MPRLLHGRIIRLDTVEVANAALASDNPELARGLAAALRADLHAFGYLFSGLQNDDANLLPTSQQTRDALVALGRTMLDPGTGADPGDSPIPAAYTYFGQFVDHDNTLEATSSGTGQTEGGLAGLLDPALEPLALEAITDGLRNLRTATLDLDTVYGPPAPRDGDEMELGIVTAFAEPVPQNSARPERAKDDPFQDLPREPRSTVTEHDRAALIGDPRNDENLIVAQLHVAFLRAHNELVRQGKGFAQAQRLLRQHYQHIVVHDFLRRVADEHIVDDILQHGNKFYKPGQRDFFLPLEYTVAAFRFGHTMVRGAYNFNLNFGFGFGGGRIPATLALLFTFTALKGELGFGEGTPTLPENWIIEWKNIIDAGGGVPFNKTRRLDTKLVEPLFHLRNLEGAEELEDGARLAVRNLLRGYLLRMPTGQAVARALGRAPLTPAQIEAAAASPEQVEALRNGGFLERTPLWYYLLAEAAAHVEAAGGGGQRLGPVAPTIVAEVLIGLVRRSKNSILDRAHWQPSLPSAQPGTFELVDLLRFAKVLA